jgi:hypothetical protein
MHPSKIAQPQDKRLFELIGINLKGIYGKNYDGLSLLLNIEEIHKNVQSKY